MSYSQRNNYDNKLKTGNLHIILGTNAAETTQEYGDANNLWVHETSLMHLDKALLTK